jgi:hypothetical protein
MVERNRLIEFAPQYYQAAFCVFFSKANNKVASSVTLWSEAKADHGPTLWHALNVLVDKGMLGVIPDDFGPPIYSIKPTLSLRNGQKSKNSPTHLHSNIISIRMERHGSSQQCKR